ncbi:hypothetical protein CCAX7_65170 [Capsulimonas corticalis]|uniref:Uncharacterized protein n=1 Tax=Capsulimonas corticalis TaxID=2219043 RepID=A0A402CQQ5_9BACT|nr:hypothetical protein [Capsulimonas corticalis]BDI34466.1 hypothetical protein CCAX7_65170 [Capsulimonas corticalis]
MNGSSWRILRAIVWKEWREHGKWALLAAAALTLGIAFNVTQSTPGYRYTAKPYDVFWTGVYSSVLFGSALTALLLGLVQIMPEKRRDQWAFLVHRPASPTLLFCGKVCAGLTLYLFAVVAPLLGVSIWAAIPGHLAAPFDPRLMLGGAAVILCGVNVYFGALIFALRSVRWFGSRSMPLFGAIVVYGMLLGEASEFWRTSALLLLLTAPMLLAAWGSFVAHDDETRRPRSGRIGLAYALLAGWGVICGSLFLGGYGAWNDAHTHRLISPVDQYGVLTSGRIVRAAYSPKSGAAANEVVVSGIYDLDERPIHADASDLRTPYPLTIFPGQYVNSPTEMSFLRPERYAYPIVTAPRQTPAPNLWFYIPASRRIEVYSQDARRLVREVGANGYVSAGRGRPAPFPDHPAMLTTFNVSYPGLYDRNLYVFSRQIYEMDAEEIDAETTSSDRQAVRTFLDKPTNEDILSVNTSQQLGDSYNTAYFITMKHSVRVANYAGKTLFDVPTPIGSSLEAVRLPETYQDTLRGQRGYRYFFWIWPTDANQLGGQPGEVREYSESGRLLHRTSLPSLAVSINPGPNSLIAYAGIVPIIGAIAMGIMQAGLSLPLTAAVSLGFGMLWGVLSWLTLRRAGLSKKQSAIGVVVGLVFGLLALLTMLSLYRWPARIACPACGRRRFITHELCEHCGAAFPGPARDGTEISEPVRLVLHTEAA